MQQTDLKQYEEKISMLFTGEGSTNQNGGKCVAFGLLAVAQAIGELTATIWMMYRESNKPKE